MLQLSLLSLCLLLWQNWCCCISALLSFKASNSSSSLFCFSFLFNFNSPFLFLQLFSFSLFFPKSVFLIFCQGFLQSILCLFVPFVLPKLLFPFIFNTGCLFQNLSPNFSSQQISSAFITRLNKQPRRLKSHTYPDRLETSDRVSSSFSSANACLCWDPISQISFHQAFERI